MKRINESLAAQEFLEEVTGGVYPCERSMNTEVNYEEKKEARDTAAVKEFVRSKLFESYMDME